MVTTRRGDAKANAPAPDSVVEFLSQISQALQNRGIASDWKYDEVESSLKRAVELLPEDSAVRAAVVEDRGVKRYASALLDLLRGDGADENKRKGIKEAAAVRKKKKGIQHKKSASASSLALDSQVLAALDATDVEALAKVVVSRFPSVEKGISSLASCLAKGNNSHGQVCLDIASAVAGLCSRVEDRVATYKMFSEYMKKLSGDDVDLPLLRCAVGRIHASCCSCTKDSREDGAPWTAWARDGEQENSIISAGRACYDILRLLAWARLSSSIGNKPVTEQAVKDAAAHFGYMVQLMSPFVFIGLMIHYVERESKKELEDLVLFMACSQQDEITLTEKENLKTPCYILYMNAASQAVRIAESQGLGCFSVSLEGSVSRTMPPLHVTEWLQSQPRSATIQLLIEKSRNGLKEISDALMHSIKEKELQSLASMAYSEIAGRDTVVMDEEPSAADGLLFFESTEGDLNMIPQQEWADEDSEEDEGDDDDIVVELS